MQKQIEKCHAKLHQITKKNEKKYTVASMKKYCEKLANILKRNVMVH